MQKSNEKLVHELKSKILELTEANKKLAKSEKHLKAVLKATPVSVVVVDTDQNFLESNPTGLRLFGARRAEQLIGTPLLNRIVKSHHLRLKTLMGNVMAGGEDLLECELVNLKGESRWVAIIATPILDADGLVESLLLAIRDISFEESFEGKHPSN